MSAAAAVVRGAAADGPHGTVYGSARDAGLGPALRELAVRRAPGLVPCGPGGQAVVPPDLRRTATGTWVAGAVGDRDPAREHVVARIELAGGAVELVTGAGAPSDRVDPDWLRDLAWLRLGLSEALRSRCVDHLGGRRSGDTFLLQQQMVKGELAETAVDHIGVRAVLEDTDDPAGAAGLADVHETLTTADRRQVRLLGATGMLSGGPGATAYVSELLAEVHVPAQARG